MPLPPPRALRALKKVLFRSVSLIVPIVVRLVASLQFYIYRFYWFRSFRLLRRKIHTLCQEPELCGDQAT